MKPHQEPGEEEPLGPAGSSPQASAGPDPDSAEAWFQRGLAAFRQGRLGQAAGDFHQALKRDPGHAKAWYQLGNLFFAQDRLAEAATHYLQALQHNPAHANACSQLGCVWLRQAQISRALGCFLRALELNPANALTWHHLGNAYKGQGQLDQALDAFERGLALQAGTPLTRADPLRMMNYHAWLQTLNYHPGYTPEVCFQAHRTWGERLSLSLAPLARPAQVRPAGPLRIGYVSAVFRHHAAAFFIESLLKAHDRRDFEIFCYSGLPRPDAVTRRLQSLADHWREVHGLDDRAAAEQIQRDRIDILVDLDGHTAHTRLPLFALKPAPVQVSYLGYPNTTGLSRIDYRLTDAWADPPGLTEAWHTEELVRLPKGFLCYTPPQPCPEVSELPAASGGLTFGSFNNLCKLTPAVVALWSRVLKAVPGSRLLLKSEPLQDESTANRLAAQFAAEGIDAGRLILLGFAPGFAEHLAAYGQVDIALDPFPYNGTTTTCEAMWMGVPVITLAGGSHVSRVGVSLLQSVGLEALIAEKAADYVAIAARLARDLPALQTLRQGLREQMGSAPLCDGPGFTRGLEAAYRQMWQQWGRKRGGGVVG